MGDRLGAGCRAVVVGVQRRACHVALDSGPWLVLSAADVPLAPNGVAVALTGDPGIRVGQTVALGREERGDPDADWLVSLGGASVWEPRPRVRSIAPREIEGRLHVTRATAVAEGAGRSFLRLLWAAGGDPGAALLCDAAVRGDAEAVTAAAGRLAGLGPGLTPSGDDVLAGFAAAWTLVGESLGLDAAERRRVMRALVSGARVGASPLGRVWLAHAVRGELPEPMTRFVAALFAAEPRDLVPAVRGVLAVGASSGTDWTVGFLLGAAALRPGRPW